MKKLLITLLTLLSSNIMMPAMPQQNIFTDTYAYKCVAIDMDNLTIAESILWPKNESLVLAERKEWFYNQLVELYNNDKLTQDSLLATLQHYEMYNYTNSTCKLNIGKIHIPELLKEQKNRLIRENHRLVMDSGPWMGDNAAQDYGIFSFYGTILLGISIIEKPELLTCKFGQNNIFYAGAAVTLASIAKVCSIYWTIRSREAEMNKIDKMISAIEAIEQAEKQ